MPDALRKEGRRQEEIQADLMRQYKEMREHPVMLDLLETLDNSYDAAHSAALIEIDNGTRAVAALQQASAYDKIRAYILSMMV